VIPAIVEAMRAALDAHDVDAYVDFFREDFVGERPRHPGVEVRGRDEVRESWSEIVEDVPDMRVEVPAAVQDGTRSGASGGCSAPGGAGRCSRSAA
jgi:ketosteroid isomerase-like protein